jgi:hypothetical protein
MYEHMNGTELVEFLTSVSSDQSQISAREFKTFHRSDICKVTQQSDVPAHKGDLQYFSTICCKLQLRNVQSLNFHVSPVDSGVLEPLVGADKKFP